MKTKWIPAVAVLGVGLIYLPVLAQSEGGNSGPSGGTTGISGAGGSGAEQGQAHVNGGKNTAGTSQAAASVTPAPTGEFHPPTTDPGASQH